jgi:hypothetical protein
MRRLPLCLLALLAAALPAAPASAAVADEAADQIIVRYRADADRPDVRVDAEVALEERLPLAGVELVRAGEGERADALAELRGDPDVLWAEPNRIREAADEPLFGQQWPLRNTGWRGGSTPTSTPTRPGRSLAARASSSPWWTRAWTAATPTSPPSSSRVATS